jgi:hypothetical protein
MSEWRRVPCSTNSCPEWRRYTRGAVFVRSSKSPLDVVMFSHAEWEALIAAAKNGDLDQDTP